MDRTTLLRIIALGFLVYGAYNAFLLPAMLFAPTSLILLVGTIAKAALAVASAFGIWTRKPWAPAAIVITGIAVAVLWLLYGFVLGIVAYLYALVWAALSVVLTVVVAAYVQRAR